MFSYFFGVVHTLKEDLLIIRTVLDQQRAATDELQSKRIQGLVTMAQPNSTWKIERLGITNNAQRNYLASWSLADLGFLTNHMLDPSLALKDSPQQEFYSAPLLKSAPAESRPMLVKEGILLVEGPHQSGKTSLIPKIVAGFQSVKA